MRDVRDVMNPAGMFFGGARQREYSTINDPLPMSGRLIPEFFGRRNIRDMFARKPLLQVPQHSSVTSNESEFISEGAIARSLMGNEIPATLEGTQVIIAPVSVHIQSSPKTTGKKRFVIEAPKSKSSKRAKFTSTTAMHSSIGKGQQSLEGFFKPKSAASSHKLTDVNDEQEPHDATVHSQSLRLDAPLNLVPSPTEFPIHTKDSSHLCESDNSTLPAANDGEFMQNSALSLPRNDSVHDPIESKESWSKLFTKPVAPRCEGHDEACITLVTKKPGMNLGRSFWMCPRPLGPSGAKEKNTQWRCQTFMWCSDWNSNAVLVHSE